VTAEAAQHSLKDQILAARIGLMHGRSEDFAIPGYGGRLWGTFQALDDYGEVRQIGRAAGGVEDPTEQEMYVAIGTLVRASVDMFAVIDGQKEPLGVKLGLPLAQYLGLAEGIENDRQAVFALFTDEEGALNSMALMELFQNYSLWRRETQTEAAKELEGKSEAPS